MDGPIWTIGFPLKPSCSSYFKQIRPVLLIFRIFGRFPYGFSADGVKPFRMKSFPAIYTLLYYLASSCLSITTIMALLKMLRNSENYQHCLQISISIIYIFQNFIVPFTCWLKAPQIVQYINLWSQFENEFSKEFKALRLGKLVLYTSLILVPIDCLYCFLIYKRFGFEFIHCLTYLPMIYTTDLLSMIWCTTHYEIRQQVRNLSQIISSEGGIGDVQRKRNCWLAISTLASNIGDAIGWATGGALLSLYLVSLIKSYAGIHSFMENIKQGNIAWLEVFDFLSLWFFFFFMFDSAERTSTEVGEKFSSMILKMKQLKLGKKTTEDIFLLLSCVSAFPPTVTLAGFLVVNRSLVMGFISSSTSYLVMLYQYSRK